MTIEGGKVVSNPAEISFNSVGWTDVREDILLDSKTFRYANWTPKDAKIIRIKGDKRLHPVLGGDYSPEGGNLYERRGDFFVYDQERVDVEILIRDQICDIDSEKQGFLEAGYAPMNGYFFEKLDDNLYKQKRICVFYRSKSAVAKPTT